MGMFSQERRNRIYSYRETARETGTRGLNKGGGENRGKREALLGETTNATGHLRDCMEP